MKERIEERLNKHAEELIGKDTLTSDELNFLVFIMNRIEMKENTEKTKEQEKERSESWKQSMYSMIENLGNGGSKNE